MKHNWMQTLGTLVLCAALLTGCTLSGGTPADSTASADPLTGQELLYPGQRIAAVVIDNSASDTPQWGIGSASVVLEALTAADAAPSLCLVYPSLQAMPTVGPVTLGEDLYWRLLSGQQVLPIQRGAGQYTRNYLEYYNIRAVDALEVGRNAFSSGTEWATSPAWRTSGADAAAVLPDLGISSALSSITLASSAAASETEPDTPVVPPLLPLQTNSRLPDADAADAVHVTVNFQSLGSTGFVYQAEQNTYAMLHADGTPQTDANTGQQAAFDNLLILYSTSTLRDDEHTLDYDLSMGGGVWLNGGHLWYITWTQGTDSTFAFYDSDGRPLTLESGRSYIALLSSLTGQELAVQNSAGEDLLAVEE